MYYLMHVVSLYHFSCVGMCISVRLFPVLISFLQGGQGDQHRKKWETRGAPFHLTSDCILHGLECFVTMYRVGQGVLVVTQYSIKVAFLCVYPESKRISLSCGGRCVSLVSLLGLNIQRQLSDARARCKVARGTGEMSWGPLHGLPQCSRVLYTTRWESIPMVEEMASAGGSEQVGMRDLPAPGRSAPL